MGKRLGRVDLENLHHGIRVANATAAGTGAIEIDVSSPIALMGECADIDLKGGKALVIHRGSSPVTSDINPAISTGLYTRAMSNGHGGTKLTA